MRKFLLSDPLKIWTIYSLHNSLGLITICSYDVLSIPFWTEQAQVTYPTPTPPKVQLTLHRGQKCQTPWDKMR